MLHELAIFAECADQTALFFAADEAQIARAKTLCRRCSVREECLEEALGDTGLVGIWGGLTEVERRQLRRTLRTAG